MSSRKFVFSSKSYSKITDAEAKELRASVNRCEICSEFLLVEEKQLDHNHETDEIRGVLCRRCNTGLGFFKDSAILLNKAISYLKSRGTYARKKSK